MKIKNKIILSFLGMGLVVCLYGLSHSFIVSQKITEQEILSHLESVASDRSNHIETYLKQNIERLKLVTSRDKLRTTLNAYNQKPDQEKVDIMKEIIISAKESVEEIERICVIGLDGVVISSTDNSFCGKDVKDKVFFLIGKEKEGVYFVDEDDKKKIFVSGPFILNNKIIGVGITVVSADIFESIVKNRTGLRNTGEVLVSIQGPNERIYLFDRLFENEALPQIAEGLSIAEPMKKALMQEEKTFKKSLDYRNKNVLSVSRYIKTGQIGLVAKIDRAEIFNSIFLKLIQTYLIIFILIITLVIIIGNILIKSISKPILSIQRGIKKIEGGDFNYKIGKVSGDEIGLIAESFDQMVETVKKSRAEIDMKVIEQTKEIKENARKISDQQKATLNILEDIEKEKRISEDLKVRLDLAVKSAGIGVWDWDIIKNNIVWDDTMFNLYGIERTSDTVAYDVWKNGLHPEDMKRAVDLLNGAVAGKAPYDIKFRVIWPDKSIHDIRAFGIVVKDKDGKPSHMIGVNFDITKEKEIDKAKSEFVSLASHQLRTPLSTINWYSEMLLAGDAGAITPEQKKYLEEIYAGNQRMVELVNALLNVSRIDLGTFIIEPEPINLGEFYKLALEELKDKLVSKKIDFRTKIEDVGEILLDKKLTHIIFQNLLSNAIKYTQGGGWVELSISKKDSAISKDDFGKYVLIKVSDNGLGIPEKDKSKIFGKLFRSDNVKKSETEGTGLGLYLIKSIIESSGGKIWFESKENEGTTFFVEIPLEGMKMKKDGVKLT